MAPNNTSTAVDQLVALLQATPEDEKQITKAQMRLIEIAKSATVAERSDAVQKLAPWVGVDELKHAGRAALICGTLVECGADPSPMAEPVLARLMPVLQKIADEPQRESEQTGDREAELAAAVSTNARVAKPVKPAGLVRSLWRMLWATYKFRRAMAKHQRQQAKRTYTEEESLIEALSLPTIAMFSASPALRIAHPEMAKLASTLADRVECCGWLTTIFEVLEDEPLLVIEPSTHIGILARLSGTDINFSLTMLLMHHFPGPDGRPCSRLSESGVRALEGERCCSNDFVTGVWNLHNWDAIESSFQLPEGQKDTSKWIWNEGKPADIAIFEGRRVILLGPVSYCRTWPAQRTFGAMKPSLVIEKVLTVEEVDAWLARMVAARPAA